MALFQFRRKIDVARDYSLTDISVFSALTSTEQELIEKKARLVEYKRGDLVYEEGTESEAFYIVISGRFRLYTKPRANHAEEETLIYFYRGDHFGETSLLSGNMHSGSVEAKKDGLLLRLDKADFLKLIKEIPSISLHLSRSLGHRLTRMHDDRGKREVKIAALYSDDSSREVMQTWLDFAGELNKQTNSPVIFVDFCKDQKNVVEEAFQNQKIVPIDFTKMDPSKDGNLRAHITTHAKKFDYICAPTENLEFEEKNERKLGSLITFLTYRYNYLLLRLPPRSGGIAYQAIKRSDNVYIYSQTNAVNLGETASAIAEFKQSYGFSQTEIRVLVPHKMTPQEIPYEEQEEMLGTPIFTIVPSATEQSERYEGFLRYIAKELAGTLVGLVLGSGAAFGLAHIGVLRVLEEEGIEIDVVAGSSIGALIGAFWAAGYDSHQLEKLALSINKKNGFFKLIGFRDLSIAHKGFLKGNQVKKFIQSFLGERTFQDLKIPVKICAADLVTSEEVIFDTGNVVDAVRASISIPGIFRPFVHKGKHLIDGGVIDPLPVKVLTKFGVRKIIAVNVLASPQDRKERNILHRDQRRRSLNAMRQKKVWSRIMARGFNQVQNRYAVNIFNVIMSTVQFMEYEIADSWGAQADVLIHPVVPEAHWAEFYSPMKFIEEGARRTREQIENIKKLVAE